MDVQIQQLLTITPNNTDDGSCIYPGCTDPLATNYDPNKT